SFRIAHEVADTLNSVYLLAQASVSLGSCLSKLGKNEEAEKYLNKGLTLSREKGIKEGIAQSQLHLGLLYSRMKQSQKALPLLEAAYGQMTQDSLRSQTMANVTGVLAEVYAENGDFEKAFQMKMENQSVQDSVWNERNIREITKMEKDFAFNQEREKTELLHAAELKQERTVQIGMGIGLALLGLLAFVILRNNRNKAKANALLADKNEEISKQKDALEKSNYTKDRIFAILGHDLRKPALAFRGVTRKVNYLIQKGDYERINQLGKSIEDDALGLTTLTDNLLKWALTQKDALSIKKENVNLGEVISEVSMTLSRLATDKKIEIKTEIPENTMVQADRNS
ncbi:MAG: tetratricopeptide repeat-containing sensor histidine kinase, partial [Saprospiraceae bacterium]